MLDWRKQIVDSSSTGRDMMLIYVLTFLLKVSQNFPLMILIAYPKLTSHISFEYYGKFVKINCLDLALIIF